MRNSSPIEPMWEADGAEDQPSDTGSRFVRRAARLLGGLARTLNPPLHRWLVGKAPSLRVSWGPTDYAIRPDGVITYRREGPGWADNPRSNYNERIEKRQATTLPAEPLQKVIDAEPVRAASEPKVKKKTATAKKARSRKASAGKKKAKTKATGTIPENGGGRPTPGSG